MKFVYIVKTNRHGEDGPTFLVPVLGSRPKLMQDSSLQNSANEGRLALQDVNSFLRAPNETRCLIRHFQLHTGAPDDNFLPHASVM